MSSRKSANTIRLITGFVSLASLVHAGDSTVLAGQILGEVRSVAGVSQMGAAVYLYNQSNQLIRQVLSNQDGKFVFEGVTPDVYWIRVTLASFLPAFRRDIAVAAGSESELRINLSSVLKSVDLAPGSASPGTLMTDDWKWVLRSSHSTRPVLRLQPGTSSSRGGSLASVFSDTSGMVRVSAGDGNLSGGTMQQDLGTAFALATSVNGSNRVHVSGNLGYAATGVPSAGFRTTYSRDSDGTGTTGPRMALTVRQIYLPSLSGSGAGVYSGGLSEGSDTPVLRTASLSMIDQLQLTDALNFEYGFGLDSVSLFGRITYFSPFARATYNLGNRGAVLVAYSNGGTPTELINGGAGSSLNVSQDLAALGQLPNISRRDDNAAVQRTKSYEAGYQLKRGARTYSASVYRDEVSNAAFLISSASGLVGPSDLLPDLNSRGIVYNVGDFQRGGYGVSVDQALGDHAEMAVAGGRGDALVTSAESLDSGNLRASIHSEARPWVTGRVGGSVPQSGTYLATSYGWSDPHALTPTHAYLTGKTNQQIGWNIHARQRLPAMGNMHMELTAEMQNMLAQGYLTLRSGGQRAVLTNSPRAVRGGLNFIF